ncbi:MAG: sulfite exporter TauE/SafE family protein [Thermodesulfobium sp.]
MEANSMGILSNFITLDPANILFLLFVGFVGGLVSGFIGSGGAFVLTPGMMSIGVPGTIAVASNMCHKFPKSMVGAYKRWKYGQVDIKLGLVMAISAILGVQVGIQIQEVILKTWGNAGSNLYVSTMFIIVLTIVGAYVFKDALNMAKSKNAKEETTALAKRIQSINIPPMIYFGKVGAKISFWVTFPIGFCTGLLAATIAVGGFIGVPGMIYVLGVTSTVGTATELVIAFVMGLVGSVKWAMSGMIDIRLTLIILAGSLIGVQIGAAATTFVKPYLIKFVMGFIMLLVAGSRILAVPQYLNELNIVPMEKQVLTALDQTSFIIMSLTLLAGALIIVFSMIRGKREIKRANAIAEVRVND